MPDSQYLNIPHAFSDKASHFLISSKAISVCRTIDELIEHVDSCLKKLELFCSYQLTIAEQNRIKHFEDGQVKANGQLRLNAQMGKPSNCELGKSKIIELESCSIFKLHFIQLHIEHRQQAITLSQPLQNLLMMWLQQIETWCFMWKKQN